MDTQAVPEGKNLTQNALSAISLMGHHLIDVKA